MVDVLVTEMKKIRTTIKYNVDSTSDVQDGIGKYHLATYEQQQQAQAARPSSNANGKLPAVTAATSAQTNSKNVSTSMACSVDISQMTTPSQLSNASSLTGSLTALNDAAVGQAGIAYSSHVAHPPPKANTNRSSSSAGPPPSRPRSQANTSSRGSSRGSVQSNKSSGNNSRKGSGASSHRSGSRHGSNSRGSSRGGSAQSQGSRGSDGYGDESEGTEDEE